MSGLVEHDARWFSIERHSSTDQRVLACITTTKAATNLSFLTDGISELVTCVQRVSTTVRGPEHAGAVVLFAHHEHRHTAIALAAVRGFVLSAAEELSSTLRLNLVVHRPGSDGLKETLAYLTAPQSSYVHASTIILDGIPA